MQCCDAQNIEHHLLATGLSYAGISPIGTGIKCLRELQKTGIEKRAA
jgi:hypothetical protein